MKGATGSRGAAAMLLCLGLLAEPRGALAVEVAGDEVQGAVIVSLRVRSVMGEGRAGVDKGRVDGLRAGDEVLLRTRTGETLRARVLDVALRGAVIEALDVGLVFEPGMGGEVSVPLSRFEVVGTELSQLPEADQGAEAAPETAPSALPEPTYENTDEDWSEGMPLLAGVRPPRPSERATRLNGRYWAAFDGIDSGEAGRSDTFVRSGLDLVLENAFGRGERLHLDAEWNQRRTLRDDEDDLAKSEFRFERFSYAIGGTRFERDRLEAGRFLQHGMPQFGVLDGVEWGRRERGSNGFGASLGFQPEPDPNYESGHDFQIAGWYRWVSDPTEIASAAVGYQKTWHNGAADRDLVVIDAHYLPADGWRFLGTAWIDLYTSGDDAKDAGPEVTQLIATASNDLDGAGSLSFVYSHLAYPQLDRDEFFPPVLVEQLADEAIHRLRADLLLHLQRRLRLISRLGVWSDDDDEGADGELGFELDGLLGPWSRLRASAYGTDGEFTTALGARAALGIDLEPARLDVSYDVANQRQVGFSTDNDDFRFQRLRVSAGWRPRANLSLSAYVDTVVREGTTGYAGGVFAQWTF
ncbi:MAG: hypothetical protein GC161_04495 [Planctomycetaceae bacterium]|nr:hypothetical protein [Planctomycetaceae bacterium]